ncbi:hypothetical protein A3K48_03725 [candidate division WOR-1 bacterium RIFOXYA12_FULL_52_29]|uniref:Ion-translocating oxidoreductase complex subunit G n=1 Tax=candidate division WOR-1 bacterium RIFOXYC12_FULL_54_18 TaxID=1802584 RepID=A0A1F4T676_UNCSA|nr:MAG: hypothetical protein A3K44_03725 [candidate division WOR-1 bacterium RIFOXYA2_FULL_51_19]OGC17669.1 MAG: hypothetical protein A3K48_03725 [candidate division WOR-1 bacterium RIFOXYA12_FULL_52_29]OGC26526.1 MAG: hypothetical protein A3K32_03720 [candidate division WOR-1 bacterium RIFOXYB2_FULL_45_9]OGC28086.1 MAG: hypothetical protein A3K49_03725 [candidate division WOR-1 bacterium RIFOXYC12_FULL_54_18]OGC29628.1 MAG: hypothetical protein A2346_02610 [candidate division WOR-1 bacterium R
MLKNLKLAAVLTIFCLISAGALAYVYNLTRPMIAANSALSFKRSMGEVISADSFTPGSQGCYLARKGKETVGYVFPVNPAGYGGAIEMMVSLDKGGKVIAVKIISNKETPGLGTNILNPKFLKQFSGKSVGDKIKAKEDIDAVTGATISSNGVCKGVRQALELFGKVKP